MRLIGISKRLMIGLTKIEAIARAKPVAAIPRIPFSKTKPLAICDAI
jgi:hypothetical protein